MVLDGSMACGCGMQLLHIWIAPQLAEEDRLAGLRRAAAISSLTNLIEWHPLVQQNMVRPWSKRCAGQLPPLQLVP